ncbi:redox-sensing transcriptional repressor Rex [Gemmata sp. JC717]|uniref:redox-sensing transcriptional repressor Rex n=1 Tax=Gemmata algarum TaxID=2975278 RepID=UPI0021BB75A0|nr:redox-sensing transcriptional repressor Rex [Gemmata algarum]MDY3551547.1 redox-sensing transcriptional repressor Rex [Gemmata algarum]
MDGLPTERSQRLSRAAALRLSLYLRCVAEWPADGDKVSSSRIADAVGVSDAQVRRDLAALGHLGQRGVGYDARELAAAIRTALGIDRAWRAVLVGVGNLGRALLRYQGFRAQGFQIVGLFDSDPAKIGTEVEGLTVEPVTRLAERAAALRVELGVLTVPGDTAHAVAEALVGAGVRGILNFAPVVLKLPRKVRLVTVDLAIQLEQLAFQVQHGDGANRDDD